MVRIPLLAAALLLLAACAPDVVDHDNGAWLVTQRAGEVDYELGGQVLNRSRPIGALAAVSVRRWARAMISWPRKLQRSFVASWSGSSNNFVCLGKVKRQLTWLLIW